MDKGLVLYSTSACHLCERAAGLLASMPELQHVPWAVVDIAEDEALVGRYGMRIPVLVAGVAELAWPFNAEDVVELIDAQP